MPRWERIAASLRAAKQVPFGLFCRAGTPPLNQQSRHAAQGSCQKPAWFTSIGWKDTFDWRNTPDSVSFHFFRLGCASLAPKERRSAASARICRPPAAQKPKIIRKYIAGMTATQTRKRPAENTCRIVKRSTAPIDVSFAFNHPPLTKIAK